MKIALWSARFFKFVYFTHHSHVTGPESQSNCIISGMCGPPGFHFLFIFLQMGPKSVVHLVLMSHNQTWKTGWTTRNFHAYFTDLLPFMVIFERMLWRQSCPPAYHHPVVCILDIITNKFIFLIEIEIWNKKSKNYF